VLGGPLDANAPVFRFVVVNGARDRSYVIDLKKNRSIWRCVKSTVLRLVVTLVDSMLTARSPAVSRTPTAPVRRRRHRLLSSMSSSFHICFLVLIGSRYVYGRCRRRVSHRCRLLCRNAWFVQCFVRCFINSCKHFVFLLVLTSVAKENVCLFDMLLLRFHVL
jgi:hypothetical protein